MAEPTAPKMLPEHAANPFVSVLGPPRDLKSVLNALHCRVPIADAERSLPPHLRRYAVLRLKDWFLPSTMHTVVEERIGMLIRRGYEARNPASGDFARRLARTADEIEAGAPFDDAVGGALASSADALALLGTPGMGKTRLYGRVLRMFEQVVQHRGDLNMKQVVWLDCECPTNGSLSQLCKNILAALDAVLGRKKYARSGRMEVGDLLLHVAQALQVHAVGVLVIDEINFLNAARTDKDRVVNFLTSLVNVFCVPVLFVGTYAAEDVVTGNLRNARRGSGLGSIHMQPYALDAQWETFTRRMFRYQWLTEPTTWSPELSGSLWDHSQGVLDVAVKLFMLSQMRVIRAFEVDGGEEILSADLFADVSRTDLSLVQPMIAALRRGDPDTLLRYGDLAPLRSCFAGASASYGVDLEAVLDALDAETAPAPDPQEALRRALAGMALPEGEAERLFVQATGIGAAPKKGKVSRPSSGGRGAGTADMPPGDARRIRAEAGASGTSGYDAFRAAGMIA